MSKIFQNGSKNAEQFINRFIENKSKFEDIGRTLESLKKELHNAHTTQQFDNSVQKIINETQNAHQFISALLKEANQEVLSKVMARLHGDSQFKNCVPLLNDMENANRAASQKEALSLKEALVGLDAAQQHAFLLFIQKVKELKPIAASLVNQEEVFKKRLQNADSLEEVDTLETEIEIKNQVIEGALERLLPYPTDELVAGQILKFLKENRHLLAVLQSFDLHETLMDDLLDARELIAATTEFSSNFKSILCR
ncbi:hypothetical protein [Fluoribacter dumoffii]|uniref:Uncharacterized protein n=1 Tax=Fluoribacter dumoffii TaxID=463 RepID=A0A377GCB7_9GAMM|nr:hypothetical protein [Fluoribacter dumoffii]KTC90892.1 hypothetical protein Ldum_1960 [Fluoribacter dumoffii NY 23]STO22465.1 Uncharacterised protein [Fluoribacter dumoffii]